MDKLTLDELKRASERIDRAIAQFKAGAEVTETCLFCTGRLEVRAFPAVPRQTNFDIRCPCGKSNTRQLGI